LLLSHVLRVPYFSVHATASPAIYTLSLHDALPISHPDPVGVRLQTAMDFELARRPDRALEVLEEAKGIAPTDPRIAYFEGLVLEDRKSTRLNSSHVKSSYAVFCLKKKKKTIKLQHE